MAQREIEWNLCVCVWVSVCECVGVCECVCECVHHRSVLILLLLGSCWQGAGLGSSRSLIGRLGISRPWMSISKGTWGRITGRVGGRGVKVKVMATVVMAAAAVSQLWPAVSAVGVWTNWSRKLLIHTLSPLTLIPILIEIGPKLGATQISPFVTTVHSYQCLFCLNKRHSMKVK